MSAHASSTRRAGGGSPLPYAPCKAAHRPFQGIPTLRLDPARCTGCGLCRSVCGGRETGTSQPGLGRIRPYPLPATGGSFCVFCQHCREPKCLAACPQGAVTRDAKGVVRMDKGLCVNCGMCQQACLEAAPMRTALGDVRKCDLCAGHQPPACVTACPNGALSFDAGKKAKWIGWVRWPVQICSFLLLVMVLVGSVCSLSIAALDIACPTGVAQNILSSRTLLLTTLASAGLLALAAILLGRGFCGWVCPFGLCLDIVDRLAPRAFRLPAWLGNRLNKYGALAGALAASAGSGTQAFCAVCPIGTVCRSYGVQSTLGGAEIAMVPLVAALDLAGKRTWCRYFCPVGAVFAIFARLSPLTVRINGRRCRKFSCKRCAEVCPMGIIAAADLEDGRAPRISRAECINCLRCVDVCPYKAARVRLALPRIPFLTGSPKKQPAGEPCSQVRTS